MDELNSKRREKFLNKNKDTVFSILDFIENKEIIKESITYHKLESLKDVQLLKEYLVKHCTDSTLLLTNFKGTATVINTTGNIDSLFEVVVELVSLSFGNFEFFIELMAFPRPLGFRNDKGEIMYLLNYDKGTIYC